MSTFCEVVENVYRLKVPFESVYTSVFLIKHKNGAILVDAATTDYDVDRYIVPALENLGVEKNELLGIVITHDHSDHAGGLKRILEYYPNISVIRENSDEFSNIKIYPLYGHTTDFIGVFDIRSKTLISGDGIQGAGIGRYRCLLASKELYRQTLEYIENDQEVENLLFSHEYEPWYKDYVFGRENVLKCVNECKKYI